MSSPLRSVVSSDDAPKAMGAYSPAIRAGNLLFVSGQIPIEPKSGTLLTGDITEQTEQVMRNITALLKAAGADFNNVVRTTVFLADMNDFNGMNAVYLEAHRRPAARARHRAGGPPAPRRQDRNRRHRGPLVDRSAWPRVFRPALCPRPAITLRVPPATRACRAGERCDRLQEATSRDLRALDARRVPRKHLADPMEQSTLVSDAGSRCSGRTMRAQLRQEDVPCER